MACKCAKHKRDRKTEEDVMVNPGWARVYCAPYAVQVAGPGCDAGWCITDDDAEITCGRCLRAMRKAAQTPDGGVLQ